MDECLSCLLCFLCGGVLWVYLFVFLKLVSKCVPGMPCLKAGCRGKALYILEHEPKQP